MRRAYRKRADAAVTAVRLDLDTDGLVYRKWGSEQRGKPGDWLVDNDGDVYTVDAASFVSTYERTAPGRYVKRAPVWAERAKEEGEIRTREGVTRHAAGDYLVANDPDGHDAYAVSAEKFHRLYEPIETP